MNEDDIDLQNIEIEYEMNDIDEQAMVLRAIETLKDRQQKIIADAQLKKNRLQIKIDHLMMLEHKS